MRNRGLRRDLTMRKYISRIKKELPFILVKSGKRKVTLPNGKSWEVTNWRRPESWKDADDNVPWVKLLKHNKLYGRSTMNNLEKHFKNKKIREDGKKIIKEYVQNNKGCLY